MHKRTPPRPAMAAIAIGLWLGGALGGPSVALGAPPSDDDAGFGGDDDAGFGGDDDAGFGSDDDAGFGGATTDAPAVAPPPPPSPWIVGGALRSEWAAWTERFGGDDNPFAKGRQALDLDARWRGGRWRLQLAGHLEGDAAYLHERDTWQDATIEQYAWRFWPRDSFLSAAFGAFDVTVGWQTVAQGQAEVTGFLDTANPRDLREPGLAELEDLRLPVLSTRIGWFSGADRVELLVVHESSFGLRTPPIGPFSPLPALLADQAPPGVNVDAALDGKELSFRHAQGRWGAQWQQVFARWEHQGRGVDLGFYAASTLDKVGVFRLDSVTPFLAPDVDRIRLTLDHLRYTVVGHAGATTVGDVVLRWEVGSELGRPLNVDATPEGGSVLDYRIGVVRRPVLQAMLGGTWTAPGDVSVSAEVAKAHVLDAPAELLLPVEAPVVALRLMRTMLRERLRLMAVASMFGAPRRYGWLARAEASYELGDGLRAMVGYMHYGPGDSFSPISGLDDHDRALLRLRWDFRAL